MYTEKDRPYLIEYGRNHLADLIPYDDPNYDERLQSMAESYADSEIYPDEDFIRMCEEHDKMLDEGIIDF